MADPGLPNQVSSAQVRLQRIANAMNLSVEDMLSVGVVGASAERSDLIKAFERIRDAQTRRLLVELAKRFAD